MQRETSDAVESGEGRVVLSLEGDQLKNYNTLELILGRVNYNTLLSALCSVKDTNLRNKGLAAFFAKNKIYRSVECQTDDVLEEGEEGYHYAGEEEGEAYHDDASYDGGGSSGEPDAEIIIPDRVDQYTALVCTSTTGPAPFYSDLPATQEAAPYHHHFEEDCSTVSEGHTNVKPLAPCDPDVSGDQPRVAEGSCPHTDDNTSTTTGRSPATDMLVPMGHSHCKRRKRLATVSKRKRKDNNLSSGMTVGVEPPRHDLSGYSEIHQAVLTQDADALWICGESLKRRGHSVDQKTQLEGYTPLQLALVQGCEVTLIKVLLWLGCDPLAFDAQGRPTLLLALKPPHNADSSSSIRPSTTHFIRLLALEKKPIFEEACRQTDQQGLTSLMHCAIHSWVEAMRLLLLHTPPHLVDLQLPSSGMTALHMAMLAYSTAVDNNRPPQNPLLCINLLQNSGASVRIADVEGVTPSDLAKTPLVRAKVTRSHTNTSSPSYYSVTKAKPRIVYDDLLQESSGWKGIITTTTSPPNRGGSGANVVISVSNVKVRRSYKDLEQDQSLQPKVRVHRDQRLSSQKELFSCLQLRAKGTLTKAHRHRPRPLPADTPQRRLAKGGKKKITPSTYKKKRLDTPKKILRSRRRLGSIANDVEIIRQAVARQQLKERTVASTHT